MKCPYCNNESVIANHAFNNADNYGKSALIVTDCCGKIVRLIPVRSYRITTVDDHIMEDDWGRKAKGVS